MRQIIKTAEPPSWTRHRLTPGAEYEATPDLRTSLIKEQGYLCAYCQSRINYERGDVTTTRIDHIKCRARHPDLRLDYQNMVICCAGNIANISHCDRSKEEQDISFDLFTPDVFDTLRYNSHDGEMRSTDKTVNDELNRVLNLNHAILKANRCEALKGIIQMLSHNGRKWSRSKVQRLIDEYSQKDRFGCYMPYNGIVLWFLNKKISL